MLQNGLGVLHGCDTNGVKKFPIVSMGLFFSNLSNFCTKFQIDGNFVQVSGQFYWIIKAPLHTRIYSFEFFKRVHQIDLIWRPMVKNFKCSKYSKRHEWKRNKKKEEDLHMTKMLYSYANTFWNVHDPAKGVLAIFE